jgi:DNA-binding MarR family transcriptional regulator
MLAQAGNVLGVTKAAPLNDAEEVFWRALMRIMLSLPRRLDSDLVRTAGVTANEYTTLMCLSEAPRHELRMADLASAAALSASRMTRLVDDLQARGLVIKRPSPKDGRGNVAKLTPAGLAKLKKAWPAHLASARALVFDHVDPATLTRAAQALSEIAGQLETGR